MAEYTSSHVTDGPFFDAMFSGISDKNFADQAKAIYSTVAKMFDPQNQDYDFNIQCNDKTEMCQKAKFFAHMSDSSKRMNFCDKFFDENKDGTEYAILSTDQRLSEGGSSDKFDLRKAQRCRSAVLVHEATHTSYATGLSDGR